MKWSFGLATLSILICIACIFVGRKDLAPIIGVIALLFGVVGLGAMTLCDLRQRPPRA